MLDSIWEFFKSNREAISALGAGLVAMVGGGWALFRYFAAKEEKPAAAPRDVRADKSSVAIGRDANNSPINIGTSKPPKR